MLGVLACIHTYFSRKMFWQIFPLPMMWELRENSILFFPSTFHFEYKLSTTAYVLCSMYLCFWFQTQVASSQCSVSWQDCDHSTFEQSEKPKGHCHPIDLWLFYIVFWSFRTGRLQSWICRFVQARFKFQVDQSRRGGAKARSTVDQDHQFETKHQIRS